MTFAPGKIYPGTVVFPTASFTDDNGVLENPSTVQLDVMDPVGRKTTYVYGTSPELTRVSTGFYRAQITPDSGGRWHLRWSTTGNVMAVEDNFIVQVSPFVDQPYVYPRDYR